MTDRLRAPLPAAAGVLRLPALPRPDGPALRGAGGWLALYWATAVVAYTAATLYLGHPAPDVAGVPLLGAAARASVSATFWSGACLAGFGVAFLFPRLGRGRIPLLCAAATALISLVFYAQGRLYCQLGWISCSKPVAASVVALPLTLMMGVSLVSVGHAFAHAARHREEEIRAGRLGADLVRAQLDALAVQLRPHFLFNTLQSVATLMHRDPAAAQEMLARLRVLLERSTRAAEAPELPLEQELELLKLYTEIESVRFGSRLRVDVRVGPDAGVALVPHLLLQPLVENAVRHAVERLETGRIEVRAWLGGDPPGLTLEVRDNGAGLPPGWSEGPEGVGLANTRARLQTLYGARHRLELESRPGEGLTVRIRIPFRMAPNGARA